MKRWLLQSTAFCLASAAYVSGSPAQVVPSNPEQRSLCHKYGLSDNRCDTLSTELQRKRLLAGSAAALDPTNLTEEFVREQITGVALARAKQLALQAISTAAATTQVGAAPGQAGSTNLVSKPTVTDFLSAATEFGGFTDTQNGTSVTLQANANGVLKYVSNRHVFNVNGKQPSDFLQPLSFTLTMTINQNSATATTTSGAASGGAPALASVLLPSNNTSFSGFEARYNFYRRYAPTSKDSEAAADQALSTYKSLLDDSTTRLAVATNDLISGMDQDADLNAITANFIRDGGVAEAGHGDFTALVRAYVTYSAAFVGVLRKKPTFNADILELASADRALDDAVQKTVFAARGTPLATVTYSYDAPVSQPAMHTATLVGSYLFKGGKKDPVTLQNNGVRTFLTGAQFTGNFTGSVYASLPAGAAYGRFRDVQLSAEFDKPFGGTTDAPRGTLSLAGYGQYQYDPTVLNITAGNLAPGTNITLPSNAQVLLGTAGWLGVVQGKLVINLSKGLSLPIALKYSNKTDLLDANDIRGQFGLSYDLSALSKLITGNTGSAAQ